MSSIAPKKSHGRLCAKHGLVVARDRRCVLCRRGRLLWPTPQEKTLLDHAVSGLLLVGLVGASVLLARSLTAPNQAPVATAPEAAAAPPVAVSEPAPAPETAPAGDAGMAKPGANAAPEAPEIAVAAPAAPAPDWERRREADTRREMIHRARPRVKVHMYSTDWCLVCDDARYYLQSADVTFEERRVDLDGEAAEKLARLNDTRSVPTFTVDGEVMVGYNPYLLERVIDARATEAARASVMGSR